MKTSVVVNLRGNLDRQAKKYTKSINDFSKSGRLGLNRLGTTVGKVGSKLNKMGNRFGALVAGAAVTAATKKVIDFDAALMQMAVNADITDERLAGVKEKIFEIANQPDIKINPNQLLAALDEVTAQVGDFDVGFDNLQTMAKLIRATGASGRDAASLVANFYEKLEIKNPDQMLATLDEAARLGKVGAFELANLATEGNSVTSAFKITGRTGPLAAREMLAMLQIVKRAVPTAAEASTAFERLIQTLTIDKVEFFQKNGVQIWDQEELKKGNKIARSIPAIILDILKVSGGDQEILGKHFDIRAFKALMPFIDEFKTSSGSLPSMDKFMGIEGDGAQLLADARRNAATAKAGLQSLSNKAGEATDDLVSQPTKDIARAVEGLSSMSAVDNTKIISGVLLETVNDAIRIDRPLRALGRGMIDLAKMPFRDSSDGIQLAPGLSESNARSTGRFPGQPTGKVELEIKSDLPVTVRKLESNNLDIEVGTGMVTP